MLVSSFRKWLSTHSQKIARSRRRSRANLSLQHLEDRVVPTVKLFLDFGDGYGSGLAITKNQISGTFAAGGLQGPDLSSRSPGNNLSVTGLASLITGVIDYNNDSVLDVNDYLDLRDDVVSLVKRVYEPFNIDIEVVSNNSVAGIAASLTANNSQPLASGIRDGYVMIGLFTDTSNNSSLGPPNGLLGIAGVDTNFSPPTVITNDLDNTTVVMADTIIGFTDTSRELASLLAFTIIHEAGHSFTIYHLDPGYISGDSETIVGSEVMIGAYTGDQEGYIPLFTRFPLPMGDFNFNYNQVQNPYEVLADFARSNIGARSDATLVGVDLPNPGPVGPAYVTGTGAHDIITITVIDETSAQVSVAPYTSSSYSTLIDIPGTTATTYDYVIPLAGGILLDAGLGNDRIVLDATLGVSITLRGMGGTDQLVLNGDSMLSAVYTPEASVLTGFDGQPDRRGTILAGSTSISFQEFETTSRITFNNFDSVTFQSPGGADTLTLNQVSGTLAVQGTIAGGFNFVPITLANVANFVLDAGNNDTSGVADTVTVRASPNATGLASVTILTGDGDDTLALSTGGLTSAISFLFDGGDGNDVVSDNTTTASTWNLTGPGAGSVDGFGFANIESVRGSSRSDTFNMLGGSLTGGIDGRGGVDTLIDGSSNDNVWNLTGINEGNYTSLGSFINVENLQGGLAADLFIIHPGAAISGLNGGEGTDSIQDNSGLASTFWNITGDGEGGYDVISLFTSIEGLIAGPGDDIFHVASTGRLASIDGGDGEDLLRDVGSNANHWTIDGLNSGGYSSVTAFLNIELLEGGSGADTFEFLPGGDITGVDGGDGLDALQDSTGLAGIWTITGVNSFTSSNLNVNYQNLEGVVGGIADDIFRILVGGRLDGVIDGGEGLNTLEDLTTADNIWTLTGPDAGSHTAVGTFARIGRLLGSTGNDTFRFDATGGLSSLLDGLSGNDTLQSISPSAQSWLLDGFNAGATDSITLFQGVENLLGGTGPDQFTFLPGAQVSGSIDGGGGSDLVNLSLRSRVNVRLTARGTVDGFQAQVVGTAAAGLRNMDAFLASGRAGDVFQAFRAPAQWRFAADGLTYTVAGNSAAFRGFDTLLGSAAADQLTIDLTSGNPLPASVLQFVGGAGVDSITVLGSALADNMIGTASGLTLNGRLLRHAGVEAITLRGQQGNDRFQISPSPATRFTVFGDAGTDLLVLKRGSLTIVGRPTGGKSGVYAFAGALPLSFFSIERIQGDKSLFLPN